HLKVAFIEFQRDGVSAAVAAMPTKQPPVAAAWGGWTIIEPTMVSCNSCYLTKRWPRLCQPTRRPVADADSRKWTIIEPTMDSRNLCHLRKCWRRLCQPTHRPVAGGWGGRIRTFEWRLQRPLPY